MHPRTREDSGMGKKTRFGENPDYYTVRNQIEEISGFDEKFHYRIAKNKNG